MHEVLARLPLTALVLDLGCARGSFNRASTQATAIRLDRERGPGELAVQADAGRLPFGDHTLHAVIANDSVEHFEDLGQCLEEIGRVIRSDGVLFVSVPDASTLVVSLVRSWRRSRERIYQSPPSD